MSGERTRAACLAASVAELHEQLGRSLTSGLLSFRAGDHRYQANQPSALRDLSIDAHIRRPAPPPHIEDTPEAQALRLDWERTEAAIGKAQSRYRQHRNTAKFRAEVAAIIAKGKP